MGGGSSAGTHQPLLRGHHLSIRAPEGELYVYPYLYLDGVVEVDGEERDDALGPFLHGDILSIVYVYSMSKIYGTANSNIPRCT